MSNIRKLILNGYFLFSLLIIVNLSLQLLPLTSETGYEFSAANSVLFFFIGGLWYLTLIEKETGVKKNLFVFFLFLIVPLLISVLNTAFIRNCPVCFGIPFYFIISLPAFFFGAVIIKGISVLSNRFRIILFLIVFLLLCIIPVLEIYFLPQIYFYHPVITFFPGTMYDELIPIDEKMILYRGLNLIFFFALFLFFSKDYFVRKKFTSVALIFISVVVWYFLFKPLFGFDTTNSKIQNELSNKIKTEHIDIYYSPELDIDSTALKFIHIFYYDKLTAELKIQPKGKITSYIFKDRRQKKRLFGSANADVAKPWMNRIYLNADNFNSTLAHELVHILAGNFGVTPFKVADGINPAMIEGFAMAFENNYAGRNVHYFAYMAYENDYRYPIESLFSGLNFLTQTSSLSYIYSGSFVKYLLDKYGAGKLEKLYAESDFEKIYGKNISTLAGEYYTFLGNLNYEINKYTAQLYFGTPPLIKKKCPRYAALITSEAWSEFNKNNYFEALKKFKELYNYTESYNAVNGIVRANIKLKNYKEALDFLSPQLKKFSKSSYLFPLEIQAADTYILLADSANSFEYIEQLKDQAPNSAYYKAALFREALLDSGSRLYRNYLEGNDTTRYGILSTLINDKNLPVFINRYISYAERTGHSFYEINKSIENKLTTGDTFLNVMAAYDYSIYCFFNGHFDNALKFATFAKLKNNKPEFSDSLEENYELIKQAVRK